MNTSDQFTVAKKLGASTEDQIYQPSQVCVLGDTTSLKRKEEQS